MSEAPKRNSAHAHSYTTNVRTWDKAKTYARENHRAPTPAEAQLWQEWRAARLGTKFRRQHAIDFLLSTSFA